MRQFGTPLLMLSVLIFISSVGIHATTAVTGPVAATDSDIIINGFQPYATPAVINFDLAGIFLTPRNPGMILLLLTMFGTLIYHAWRRWQDMQRLALARNAARSLGRKLSTGTAGPPTPRAMLHLHRQDGSLREQAPLIIALLVGSVWPWLFPAHPVTAFLLSALMLVGMLGAALRGVRAGNISTPSSSLGFVAGWTFLVCFSAFAMLLRDHLGMSQQAAVAVVMLLGPVPAVAVQLRMPRRIGFSIALIWGLLGLAATMVTTDATIATVTVFAIAIIVVALVRVTT